MLPFHQLPISCGHLAKPGITGRIFLAGVYSRLSPAALNAPGAVRAGQGRAVANKNNHVLGVKLTQAELESPQDTLEPAPGNKWLLP